MTFTSFAIHLMIKIHFHFLSKQTHNLIKDPINTSPITDFALSPCSTLHQSPQNKFISVEGVPDNQNQGMF